jgi:two-component system sensor histidine kinase RegB
VQLRWVATIGQALVIAWVELFLKLKAPLGALSAVIAFTLLSNLLASQLHRWSTTRSLVSEGPWGVFTLVSLDVLTLTALLLLTGGPYNPFSFLYLIHITLATVTLPTLLTWGVMVESIGSMGLLFVGYERGDVGRFVEELSGVTAPQTLSAHAHHAHHTQHAHHSGGGVSLIEQLMQLHVEGMWLACALGGVMIVYFTQRIQRDASEVRLALREVERRAAEAERFNALTTLTAGAAHELATPLASVALACDEALLTQDPQAHREALELISKEAQRCVATLEQLRGVGARADLNLSLSLSELIEDALIAYQEELDEPFPERLSLPPELEDELIEGPVLGLIQGIKNLLHNAHQATVHAGGQQALELVISAPVKEGERAIELQLVDYAGALSPSELARIGEPFYTTRDTGEGLGLGVYLMKQLTSQMGGELRYEAHHSDQGVGTRAVLTLPIYKNTQKSIQKSTQEKGT